MQILLIDFDNAWGASQAHLLEMACLLQQEDRFAVRVCCPRNSPLAAHARQQQVPLLTLWGTSSWNPLNLLRLWLATRRQNYSIIHSFSNAASRAGACLLHMRTKNRTVLIHTCHNVHSLTLCSSKGEMPRYWQEAHTVLCANQRMRKHLLDAGLDPRQIVCLPAGVDISQLPPRKSLPTERFIIAALTPRTNTADHSVLLKAMAALWQSENIPAWELRIIGDCTNFQALMDEAISLGVESRLAILEAQPLHEVLPLCHALVAPSINPHGSLPAMAAAWATGLPLLCPALPTNQEWAVHEENALLYKAGDPQELATLLKRLMRDAELYQSLVDGGLRTAPRTTVEHAGRQCRDVYARSMEKRGWVLPPQRTAASAPAENAQDISSEENSSTTQHP